MSETEQAAGAATPAAPVAATPELPLQAGEQATAATQPDPVITAQPNGGEAPGTGTSSVNAPQAQAPVADESDGAFVLRTFGVNPAKYVKAGVLDRSLLDHDVESYRTLFANRVLHGRFA